MTLLCRRAATRFVDEQKATHEYLLLTEDRGPSRRVPPSLVVAAPMGVAAPEGGDYSRGGAESRD
jgi:hypothetical protein